MINIFKYFIYEDLNNSKVYKPNLKLSNSEFFIISNENELKDILKKHRFDGYEIDTINLGLKKKAIAFCVFYENNLVHISWLAISEEAKKFIDDWPMKINWSNIGIYGLSYTHPKFKKNGYFQYTYKQIQNFLLNKNIKFIRFSIKKRNTPSISALSKFQPKKIANGYSFHLLKFKFRILIPTNENRI
jgi:hypothetical protein